ncbi:hypothetical protein D3C73_1626340 [compost metagenome]
MLENLGDDSASPEKMAQTIERAKATSLVATTYIAAVKVELDAIELHHEVGRTTVAVDAPPQAPALPGSRQ